MKTNMHSHEFTIVETFCFILLITGITASITQGPSNAVAEIGNQVELNCTADTTIDSWFLSKDGTDTDMLTIVGPGCSVYSPFGDHYRVESLVGGKACNLIVFNITMEQAGVYRCYEIPNHISSILTVIDNSPTATYNTTENVVVEDENVIITCSLSHNGSVAPAPTLRPYFYWKNFNGQNVSSSNHSTTENTAVSQITVSAEYHETITSYTCHVYLQLIPPTTPNYAGNIPTVDSSASSPPIEVLYGVNDIGLVISQRLIEIGGITCEIGAMTGWANGNPPPSYEWFDTKENVSISNDATLDLAEINRNYTCVAYNTIRNELLRYSRSYVVMNYTITQDCKFPRSESTWISVTPVEGCYNGTCSCSSGYDGFTLSCNTHSYPSAVYQWIGADNSVIYSQVYQNVTLNGIYSCTAYFDRASSIYAPNDAFPNGTSEINITECYDMSSMCPAEPTDTDSSSSDVAIAMCVLFGISLAVNITILVIWVYNHLRAKQDKFRKTENVRQSETVDLSNRTSAPSAYEELRRPDETQLQQSAYETLAPSPTKNAASIIPTQD